MVSPGLFRSVVAVAVVVSFSVLAQQPEKAAEATPKWQDVIEEYKEQSATKYGEQYGRHVAELLTIWADESRGQALPLGYEAARVELDVLKRVENAGRVLVEPVREKDALRSGADLFKVAFQSSKDVYLYIWNLDSTGKVYPMFPRAKARETDRPNLNPVRAGRRCYEPATKTLWFNLDQNVGAEFLFFLGSEKPVPEIEQLLGYFSKPPGSSADFEIAPPEDLAILTRGVDITELKDDRPIYDTNGEERLYRPHEYEFTENEIAGVISFKHVAKDEPE